MNSAPIIFFLIPRLPPSDMKGVGGGELSNILLINSIAKKYNVIVLPMITSLNNYKFPTNIKVFKPRYNLSGRIGYFLQKYLFYNSSIQKFARKYQPKKIIATRSTILSGHKAKLKFNCEFEIIVRAYEDFINIKKFDPYSRSSIFRKLERLFFGSSIIKVYKNVDRFITNSKFMSYAIQNDIGFPINCFVVYPEINLPRIKPNFQEVKTIGFINRGDKKGLNTVIELSKINPLNNFLIFGDRVVTNQDNIKNMGYVNDRGAIFKMIDLFLVPSLWNEPYGRIASEAIWSGKMVLVSNKGGLSEAAPSSFFLVESSSVQVWNKKLKEVKDNKRLVEQLILKAQNTLSNYNYNYL